MCQSGATCLLVRDSSAVRRLFLLLLEPRDVRKLYIRKTADLPHRKMIGEAIYIRVSDRK
jgi:hypothetical protein